MNIKVEKLITDGYVANKILSIDKCCNKIINSKSISINTEDDENNLDCDYENPEYSVKLCNSEITYDDEWSEATEVYHYEKINFCPFCGKPININIVNERDVTEEYYNLHEESKEIREMIQKTDSKSEETMLKERLEGVRNSIRYLIVNDDFREDD